MEALEYHSVGSHRRLFAQGDKESFPSADLDQALQHVLAELPEVDPDRELTARDDSADPRAV
jgi:hypothetical protein